MLKRYIATKDSTITNAFKANLSTRGTGSNMGASDIVEVFSIYAQASASSTEAARAMLEFPVTSISTDRTAGAVPASGNVSFYLKMFNAKHQNTLPKNFYLEVLPVSGAWTEGDGLDMEDYSDKGAVNWISASSNTAWSL